MYWFVGRSFSPKPLLSCRYAARSSLAFGASAGVAITTPHPTSASGADARASLLTEVEGCAEVRGVGVYRPASFVAQTTTPPTRYHLWFFRLLMPEHQWDGRCELL